MQNVSATKESDLSSLCSSPPFFSALVYENPQNFSQRFHNAVENYCNFLGRKVLVIRQIPDDGMIVVEDEKANANGLSSFLLGALKLASYASVVLPLIAFSTRSYLRKNLKCLSGYSQRKTQLDETLEELASKASTASDSEPSQENSNFEKNERISHLSYIYESYFIAFKKENFFNKNLEGLEFIHSELETIKAQIQKTVEDAKLAHTNKSEGEEPYEDSTHDKGSIHSLNKNANNTIKNIENLLLELRPKIDGLVKERKENGGKIRGILNVGNTCYLNSAIQPLLLALNIDSLNPHSIPQEPKQTYDKRLTIARSFQDFVRAWKNGHSTPSELGTKIGTLRCEIFKAALEQGAFTDSTTERSFKDSGQFFELILYILGMGFRLKTIKTGYIKELESLIPVCESPPQTTSEAVFYLQKKSTSLQEAINKYLEVQIEALSPENGWRISDQLTCYHIDENFKIMGSTCPDLLVLRVNEHKVDPKSDKRIDFSPLFEEKVENANYELQGFLQNHSQMHWTCIVHENDTWKNCDDSQVREIDQESDAFRKPCSYMVYKKIA